MVKTISGVFSRLIQRILEQQQSASSG